MKTWTRTGNNPARMIGQAEVLVMGDNRDDSQDSRFYGPIDVGLVQYLVEL